MIQSPTFNVIDVSELCPVFDVSGTAARLAVCVVTRIMAALAKERGEESMPAYVALISWAAECVLTHLTAPRTTMQCPLLALSGHQLLATRMSANDPKRTFYTAMFTYVCADIISSVGADVSSNFYDHFKPP